MDLGNLEQCATYVIEGNSFEVRVYHEKRKRTSTYEIRLNGSLVGSGEVPAKWTTRKILNSCWFGKEVC